MNISFCFVAFVLIISSVYLAIMRQDKQIFFDFQKLLNPEQIEKYHKIVRERFMIYVGGTLVLLIFGVMLPAQEGFVTMKTRGGDWVLAAAAGGTLLFLLIVTALYMPGAGEALEAQKQLVRDDTAVTTPIGLALVGARVDQLQETDETLADGMSGYLLPFEIVSVHLLVVLVGAAYLARAKRHADSGGA